MARKDLKRRGQGTSYAGNGPQMLAVIRSSHFHNAVIHSDIGEIDEEELDKLIRRAIDEVVIPGLNEYCKQGIPLPVTGIFRLYNAKVNLQKGYMQIATDVEYLK